MPVDFGKSYAPAVALSPAARWRGKSHAKGHAAHCALDVCPGSRTRPPPHIVDGYGGEGGAVPDVQVAEDPGDFEVPETTMVQLNPSIRTAVFDLVVEGADFHNKPFQLPAFIGRSQDLEYIADLRHPA